MALPAPDNRSSFAPPPVARLEWGSTSSDGDTGKVLPFPQEGPAPEGPLIRERRPQNLEDSGVLILAQLAKGIGEVRESEAIRVILDLINDESSAVYDLAIAKVLREGMVFEEHIDSPPDEHEINESDEEENDALALGLQICQEYEQVGEEMVNKRFINFPNASAFFPKAVGSETEKLHIDPSDLALNLILEGFEVSLQEVSKDVLEKLIQWADSILSDNAEETLNNPQFQSVTPTVLRMLLKYFAQDREPPHTLDPQNPPANFHIQHAVDSAIVRASRSIHPLDPHVAAPKESVFDVIMDHDPTVIVSFQERQKEVTIRDFLRTAVKIGFYTSLLQLPEISDEYLNALADRFVELVINEALGIEDVQKSIQNTFDPILMATQAYMIKKVDK